MKSETSVQPKLGDLFTQFLSENATNHAKGLAAFDSAEVQPFEAGPVQPIDAKLAWDESLAAISNWKAGIAREGKTWQAPPHWPNLVAAHEPMLALPFAVGNFPQLVRNFHMVLQRANLTNWRQIVGRPIGAPALEEWAIQVGAKMQFPQAFLALGALRLAGQMDAAQRLVDTVGVVPAEWRSGWENEKAALLWQSGKTEEARALWNRLETSVPVLFNRGMAELFLGNAAGARKSLESAAAQIPETSAWHHLAQLYLLLGNR